MPIAPLKVNGWQIQNWKETVATTMYRFVLFYSSISQVNLLHLKQKKKQSHTQRLLSGSNFACTTQPIKRLNCSDLTNVSRQREKVTAKTPYTSDNNTHAFNTELYSTTIKITTATAKL